MPMLARIAGRAEPWSLLPLRVGVGIVFIVHGGQKLFLFGFPGVARFLSGLGFQPPMFWAVVVTLVEFFGGIAILAGFLTRWAAALIAIEMIVAVRVSWARGFFSDKGGYELPLILLAACLTILLAGAKKPSVDQALPREF